MLQLEHRLNNVCILTYLKVKYSIIQRSGTPCTLEDTQRADQSQLGQQGARRVTSKERCTELDQYADAFQLPEINIFSH